MELFDPAVTNVVAFVDGSQQSHDDNTKNNQTFVAPAIPPPELILGEGGAYRAVLVIADGVRYPAAGVVEGGRDADDLGLGLFADQQLPSYVTHTPLFDPNLNQGAYGNPDVFTGYPMGFVRTSALDADKGPMCLAAIRGFLRQPAVLTARIAIAMARVNAVVGDTAPMVVYLLPGPTDDINWGRELVAQVATNAPRFGRRDIAVVVAPTPETPALSVRVDTVGRFTPNAKDFRGLQPGQRLLTVLTKRRKRPCWLACNPVDRSQLHRYLEVPAELISSADATPPHARQGDPRGHVAAPALGYGRRITEATVRRLVLLQRLGAIQAAKEADGVSVLYSDDDMQVQESDQQGSKRRLLKALTSSLHDAAAASDGLARGVYAEKVELFNDAVKKILASSNAAEDLGLLEQDYTTMLLYRDQRRDETLFNMLGVQTGPYIQAKDLRQEAIDLQEELVYLTQQVLRRDEFSTARDTLLDAGPGVADYYDKAENLTGMDYQQQTAEIIKKVEQALSIAIVSIGPNGASLHADESMREGVQKIEHRLDELEKMLDIDPDVEFPLDKYEDTATCYEFFRTTLIAQADDLAKSLVNSRTRLRKPAQPGLPDPRLYDESTYFDEHISDLMSDAIGAITKMELTVHDGIHAFGRSYKRFDTVVARLAERTRASQTAMQSSAAKIVAKAEEAVLRAPPSVGSYSVWLLACIRVLFGSTVHIVEGKQMELVDGLIDPDRPFAGLGDIAAVLGTTTAKTAHANGITAGRKMAKTFLSHAKPHLENAQQRRMRLQQLLNLEIQKASKTADRPEVHARFFRVAFVLSLREFDRWKAKFERELQELLSQRANGIAAYLDGLVCGVQPQQMLTCAPKALVAATLLTDILGVARRRSWFSWTDRLFIRINVSMNLPKVGVFRYMWPSFGQYGYPHLRFNPRRRRRGRWPWLQRFRLPGWLYALLFDKTGGARGGRAWDAFRNLFHKVTFGLFGGREARRPAMARNVGSSWWSLTGFLRSLVRAKRGRRRNDLRAQLKALKEQSEETNRQLRELGGKRHRSRRGPGSDTPPTEAAAGACSDLIVPLGALRLVVGPVIDGKPDSPLLFGPPVFPLVADLGRFSRVVVLPKPIPCISTIPGSSSANWIEACLARGGDVRLCLGSSGPRYALAGALGGTAILERRVHAPPEALCLHGPDYMAQEDGCIVVVPGMANAVVDGGEIRRADAQMLVVTTADQLIAGSRLGGALAGASASTRGLVRPRFRAVVGAKRQR